MILKTELADDIKYLPLIERNNGESEWKQLSTRANSVVYENVVEQKMSLCKHRSDGKLSVYLTHEIAFEQQIFGSCRLGIRSHASHSTEPECSFWIIYLLI